MPKKVIVGIGIVGILVVFAVAAYVLRPTAEASMPIKAIPVEVDQPAVNGSEPVEDTVASDEVQPEISAAGEEPQKEEISIPEDPTEEPVEDSTATASDSLIIFNIVQAESQVRFTLNEVLSGVPTTVIGATDQVAGEIAVDPTTPANSTVGVILINARTFATDNNFRNRAINNEILETGEYEFVRFTPISISGFPENPAIGDTLKFQITGDLMIRDVTNQVTFDVTATAVSETRLEGSASAVIAREDYDLKIPNVPRVADVDEEVLIEIDFVAEPK